MFSDVGNFLSSYFDNTFSSLRVKNFRLYFIGQAISVSGTFMQAVAQSWLVLKITNSGAALGLVTALQFLPMLILGPWGGVITDRFRKRRILYVTQTIFGIQALLLGFLVVGGLVRLWMVAVLAFIYGLINLVDTPTNQTFVPEMVGNDNLRNAVTLYSALVNLARVLGPLLAALLIAKAGLGVCFIVNGLSYIVIIILLTMIDGNQLHRAERIKVIKGQMKEGLKYVFNTPILRNTLLMMAIIGTFTYEFQVSLPLLAKFTFHGDANTFALIMSAQGIGSVIGGILLAGQKKASTKILAASAFAFGLFTLLTALMPQLYLAMTLIFIVGFFSIFFLSLGNAILQLESDINMRGRVMAYWSMAFLGSTAIGGPIIGAIGEYLSPRWSLGIQGTAAIIASLIGYLTVTEIRKKPSDKIIAAAEFAAGENKNK
ncbi:MFS transporter [Patescibacteria group bacterium]|nr:MFS transporter [Patescibacteria group bacterium]